QDRVIFCLRSDLEETDRLIGVLCRVQDDSEEVRRAHMIGTRASNQDPSGPQHLQGTQIEFLVSAKRLLEIALALCKRWRIENDGVVAFPGGGIVPQQVKGIALDPLDLAAIQRSISVRRLERRTRAVHTSYRRTL